MPAAPARAGGGGRSGVGAGGSSLTEDRPPQGLFVMIVFWAAAEVLFFYPKSFCRRMTRNPVVAFCRSHSCGLYQFPQNRYRSVSIRVLPCMSCCNFSDGR